MRAMARTVKPALPTFGPRQPTTQQSSCEQIGGHNNNRQHRDNRQYWRYARARPGVRADAAVTLLALVGVILHPHTRTHRVAIAEHIVHAADWRPEFVFVQR